MVSTDFNRLALSEYTLPADTDVSQKTGILISKRGLSEIARFLDTGGEVLLGREKNYFFIKKAEETLSIILMEGEFPEYKGIIRAEEGNVVELNRLDFLMMVRRMAIFTTELYKGIKFYFDSDKLTITSQDPNLGDALEEMNIQFAGEPFETVFNPQFFIDSARSLDDEYMKLNLINAQGPCRVEGCEDTSYLCVIMPMKI
jgi:DNA polymerase-3 subunit beta